jgi:glucokinase
MMFCEMLGTVASNLSLALGVHKGECCACRSAWLRFIPLLTTKKHSKSFMSKRAIAAEERSQNARRKAS